MNQKSNFPRWAVVAVAAFFATQAGGHTLFVKPDTFFFGRGLDVIIPLLNGTFEVSENRVPVERMVDVSVVAPDGSDIDIDNNQWRHQGKTTSLSTNFEQDGNYVIGIGTRPMLARITPDNFNFYLRYEGLDDNAKEREELGESAIGAAERYQKFSKAIIQVGDKQSDNFGVVLDYPVEIVPLLNPYSLTKGDLFRARVLRDGKPLSNQLIYATHEDHYDMSDEGIFNELVRIRSDENGEIEFVLEEAGRWYVRFIHLARVGEKEHWYSGILVSLGAEEPRIPYRSLWATLTFQIM